MIFKRKKKEKVMPNEIEKDKITETEKDTVQNPVPAEEKTETTVETTEQEKTAEQPATEEQTKTEEEKAPVVTETEEQGNGIRIEDLVTKDQLADMLAAIDAKLTALVEENKGLKEKNAEMSKKYEDGDFGTAAKQGVIEKNKSANETFEEYSKQFM